MKTVSISRLLSRLLGQGFSGLVFLGLACTGLMFASSVVLAEEDESLGIESGDTGEVTKTTEDNQASPSSSGGSRKLRSALWITDYHAEAQRTVKILQDAAIRIETLRERSDANLVVLDKLLHTNAESVDALSRVAEDIRLRLRDVLPLEERTPTEREKALGDRELRQLVVLKDRALALFQESASFYRKLSAETKDNVVTRLADVDTTATDTDVENPEN